MGRHWGSATTRRGRTIAYAVFAVLMCATPALAQSTGGSDSAAARSDFALGWSETGSDAERLGPLPPGVKLRPAPSLRAWACLRDCATATLGRSGSIVRLRGRGLARAYEVVFEGADGDADDVAAATFRRRHTRVDVRVPLGAAPGPLVVADRDGRRSRSDTPIGIEPPAVPAAAGTPPTVEVQARAPRAFFDTERAATVTYVVHGGAPTSVLVELLRERDGVVIASWEAADVPPEARQTLTWNGTAGGRVQPPGRYSFRVSAESAGGLRAVSAAVPPGEKGPDPAEFVFLRHAFPIRGPHGYGEHAATFGGGRGHQGQDVFAACGTPLVAARGGVVEFKQYHGRAGHYIVVDGHRTGTDYAYMHMRDAALVDEGDRVRTGQRIGYVGDTGSAFGCHLHLELWGAPGWYAGGQPFDPLPSLRAWDRSS